MGSLRLEVRRHTELKLRWTGGCLYNPARRTFGTLTACSQGLSLLPSRFLGDSVGLDQKSGWRKARPTSSKIRPTHQLTFLYPSHLWILHRTSCRPKITLSSLLSFKPQRVRPSADFRHQKEILQHLQELVPGGHLREENVSLTFFSRCHPWGTCCIFLENTPPNCEGFFFKEWVTCRDDAIQPAFLRVLGTLIPEPRSGVPKAVHHRHITGSVTWYRNQWGPCHFFCDMV